MSAIKVYARGWRFKLPVSGLFCVYGVFSDGGGAGSGGEQGGVFADLRFDAGGAVRVFGEVLFDGFAALDAAAFHGKPRACLVDDAEINAAPADEGFTDVDRLYDGDPGG